MVKTTCAGCAPRPGRGLEALHLNPFAAAASFLLLVGGREGPARCGLRAAAEPRRDGTQARGAPRCPLTPLRLAPPPCPAPFPTWRPGRRAYSLLREDGRGGELIRPDSSCRRFYTPPPLQLRFSRRRALYPTSGEERCFLSQGAGRRYGGASGTHRPGAGFLKSPHSSPIPSSRNLSLCTPAAPKIQAAPAPRSGAGRVRPGAGARVGRKPLWKVGVAATSERARTFRASRFPDRT